MADLQDKLTAQFRSFRTRSMRAVLHYGSGWPRLAFSLDGQRIFAAGMNNASTLNGWRLPAADMPKDPRWWSAGWFSHSGKSYLLWNVRSGRFEVHRSEDGQLVASGVRSLGRLLRVVGESAVAYVADDYSAVTIVDLETGGVLWNQPCRVCTDISVSRDGSRLAQVSADGLEVWNTRTGQRLFHETEGARPSLMHCAISNDGRQLAWAFVDQLFVRELDSGRELTLPLDGAILIWNSAPETARSRPSRPRVRCSGTRPRGGWSGPWSTMSPTSPSTSGPWMDAPSS